MIKAYSFIILILASSFASAFDTKIFLKSSLYGVSFGAAAGLGALAFSDEPTKNLSYVTRGASLGLYGGMLVGAYLATQDKSPESQVFLVPDLEKKRLNLTAFFVF